MLSFLSSLKHRHRPRVTLTALGGVERVGAANCYLLEGPDFTIMLDCGYMLEPILGDLLDKDTVKRSYPNFSYLNNTRKKLKAVLLSHAHQDHIAGLPEFAKTCPNQRPQIFASPFALKTLTRLEDAEQRLDYPTAIITPGQTVQLEKQAAVQTIAVPHSVPESLGFYINMLGQKILYLGDFKLNDLTQEGTEKFKAELAVIGQHEVDILLLDATNIKEQGFTPPETAAWKEIDRIAAGTPYRIIFTTFSSHLKRIEAIIAIAQNYKRPVYAAGTSLIEYLETGEITGWELLPENMRFMDQRALILTTGCQAEAGSALVRAAFGRGPFRIKPYDTIIMAADPIPIPEIESRVSALVDRLTILGRKVYIAQDANLTLRFPHRTERARVHISGHANREDLRFVMKTVKPKLVIPIHADRERREELGTLARMLGLEALVLETNMPVQF